MLQDSEFRQVKITPLLPSLILKSNLITSLIIHVLRSLPDKKGVDGDIYIRIRITSKGVKHFFNGIRSEHSDLGSIYTISEIIDFRPERTSQFTGED